HEARAGDDGGEAVPVQFEGLDIEANDGDEHDQRQVKDCEAEGQPEARNDAGFLESNTRHDELAPDAIISLAGREEKSTPRPANVLARNPSILGVYLVENAPTVEMEGLGLRPSAEYVVNLDQLGLRKVLEVGRVGMFRLARPVEVLSDKLLRFGRIE